MGRNVEDEQTALKAEFKDMIEGEAGEVLVRSPNQSRPVSMVTKKAHTVIPAHLVAEAISTLHGLDLRWSGPITPTEMQYVQQYVFAKYPEYCNGLIEEEEEGDQINLHNKSPRNSSSRDSSSSSSSSSSSPSFGKCTTDLDRTQLEPSKLLDIVNKRTSIQGSFISIPEIQVRNRAFQQCGLTEDEYLVIITSNVKEATMMIGESYKFFRGNYYMTIIDETYDCVREFVLSKDSKVIVAPENWLDLRIKGSQLSQYFRRKCKYNPKGLFGYPACNVNGDRNSMHWISEAHRNSWHVLLDATTMNFGKDRLALALHRPDFVLCMVENTHSLPSKITCLLVRKKSFETVKES